MICYSLLCLIFIVASDGVLELHKQECGPCNVLLCPTLLCARGTTRDVCQCCYVCAREKGDTCGGPWSLFGSCGHGLACKLAASRDLRTAEFVGECKADLEPGVATNLCASNPCPDQHHCLQEDGRYVCKHMDAACGPMRAFYRCPAASSGKGRELKAKCDRVLEKSCLLHYHILGAQCIMCGGPHPGCPWDSIYMEEETDLEVQCCTHISSRLGRCQCSLKLCNSIQPQSCRANFERILVMKGNGKPGSCCDLTMCRKKQREDCKPDTDCPAVDPSSSCPQDSLRVEQQMSDDKCCKLGSVCQCRPCEYSCDIGYYPIWLSNGTGLPGDCCHKYGCKKDTWPCTVHEPNESIRYSSGQRRRVSACVYNLCTNGLWSRYQIQCEANQGTESHCVKIENECCPVCFTKRGSIMNRNAGVATQSSFGDCRVASGIVFVEGETWRPSDCLVCQCIKNVVVCARPQCSEVACAIPLKVEGECCPVCHDELDGPTERVVCHYRGVEYPAGAHWTYRCQTCHCGNNGRHICSFVWCPALNCSRTSVKLRARATCCPVCLEEAMEKHNEYICDFACRLKGCANAVLLHAPHRCCPRCIPHSALQATTKRRCKALQCADGDVCGPVRVTVVNVPSELTVIDFECGSYNLAPTAMRQANELIVSSTAIAVPSHSLPTFHDMSGGDCTGQHHCVRLSVEMPHDKLTQPDITRKVAEYLERMLWQSARVYVSLEQRDPLNDKRITVVVAVRNSSNDCVKAATITLAISSFQPSDDDANTMRLEILHRNKSTSSVSAHRTSLFLVPEKPQSGNMFEDTAYIGGLVGIIIGSIIVFPTITVFLYLVYKRYLKWLCDKWETGRQPGHHIYTAAYDQRLTRPNGPRGQCDKLHANKGSQIEGNRSKWGNEQCQCERECVNHESSTNMNPDTGNDQAQQSSHSSSLFALSVDEASD